MKQIPDYSGSTARMNMYAYVCPTPGDYSDGDGMHKNPDQRTIENFRKYKECGFDTLLLLGNDAYAGETFESSDLKHNLDMALEIGLKVIVYDKRIHDLTEQEESLIGEKKPYATMEALVEQLEEWMEAYRHHPAFYGMSLKDEPYFKHLQALSEVIKAIKKVDSKIYAHTVLHPYAIWLHSKDYTGIDGVGRTSQSYRTYVGTHLDLCEDNYVSYDDYPFMHEEMGGFRASFYENIQMVVGEAAKRNATVTFTMQSFGDVNGWREVTEDDLRFDGYSALGLGVKNLTYYTYYMFPWRGKNSGSTQAIVSDDGSNMLYDSVKRVNEELQKLAKVVLNFNYVKANFTYAKGAELPKLFQTVQNDYLDGATVMSVTAPTIVSQMYDAKTELLGYMVVNATDPAENQTDIVDIRFADKEYVTIYVKGQPQTIELTNHELSLTLKKGDGVFVIPHN